MHACAISKWQGEIGLKGKLREDFYELLEKHKTDIMKTQKEAMMKDLQKERLSMEKAFAQQKTQMGKTLDWYSMKTKEECSCMLITSKGNVWKLWK